MTYRAALNRVDFRCPIKAALHPTRGWHQAPQSVVTVNLADCSVVVSCCADERCKSRVITLNDAPADSLSSFALIDEPPAALIEFTYSRSHMTMKSPVR